jgi:DNA (cytosine-5)-methyltransferase 1
VTVKLGSLFDGSGGFPLAGAMCGIEPVWASEIEPFPIKVTTARFPGMKHLGDVTKINGAEIEPVDILTFGSPCQDVSKAGFRHGLLDGKRSSLFFEAIRIIEEMRNATANEYPRFGVFENVPGIFSSNRGDDFRTILETLCNVCGERNSVPKPSTGGGVATCWVCVGNRVFHRMAGI